MDLWQAFFSLLRIFGLISSCIVLFVVSLSIKINTAIAYLAVLIIEKLTGAKPKELLTAHSQRYETKSIRYHQPEINGIIDEKETLSNAFAQVSSLLKGLNLLKNSLFCITKYKYRISFISRV